MPARKPVKARMWAWVAADGQIATAHCYRLEAISHAQYITGERWKQLYARGHRIVPVDVIERGTK